MSRKTSLKSDLEACIEVSSGMYDASTGQRSRVGPKTLHSDLPNITTEPGQEEQQQPQQNQEYAEEFDIPETKGLLPPLPTSSPNNDLESEIIQSPLSPTRLTKGASFHKTLFNSSSQSCTNLNTPNQIENVLLRAASTQSLGTVLDTSNSLSPGFQSPKRAKLENTRDEVLSYSPAIANDKFEVSLDIAIDSKSTPRTIEEKIRLYQNVQQKEMSEFDKTLKNFKKSGWMTEKELKQLETSKVENFNKWESKIKDLKLRKRVSSTNSPLQSYNTTPGTPPPSYTADDDYFRQPRIPSTPPIMEDTKGRFGSPSLQKLEQRFNSMGI